MQTKILILSCLCLYVTGVFGEDRSWRTEWSDKYTEKDTIPHVWEENEPSTGDSTDEEVDPEISARNIAKNKLWPNGVVPYEIEPNKYNDEEKKMITDAMEELSNIIRAYRDDVSYQRLCQLLFIPKQPDDRNSLFITQSTNKLCSSDVGMQGGKQVTFLSSSCLTRPLILHELLHVLGFAHQHSSHDRDQYVRIIKDNVMEGAEHNFDKVNSQEYTNYGYDYDFKSIMHYSPYALAKVNEAGQRVGKTIKAIDPINEVKTNSELSDTDKRKLMRMYCN